MRDATLAPIPTYADDDLGQSAGASLTQFPLSRRRLFLGDQPKQNMTLVYPNSRSEWAYKCPTASDVESFSFVVSYLHWVELTAAKGQAIIDCSNLAVLPGGATNEVFTPPAHGEAQRFLEMIEQNIADDSADVVAEGGTVPIKRTIDACLAIASTVSGIVAMKPTLKYAAFAEESGAISLVIQSEHPGRRVNFRASPDGRQIAVVAVTSQGHTSTNPVRIDDTESLRGWVEWLRKRD